MIGGVRTKIRKLCHGLTHEREVLSKYHGKQNIFYFGVPMHPNLGDLAQCMCIRDWLKMNYPNHNVIEVDSKVFMDQHFSLRKKLRNKIKKENLIVFQSGYCTQDLGGIEDLMHQAVMKDYPDNRLVMFPQTVFFKSKNRCEQASRIYDAHQHLLFLARDKVSYDLACGMFPHTKIALYPDIVTTLIGKYTFSKQRKGILLCMRNDTEKYYTDSEINELKNKLQAFDCVEQTDTTVPGSLNAYSANLREYINAYIENFTRYRLILTDRYHGTIFSLVAQTPVIVVKTTDHKVRTGVEWFNGVYDNCVAYADTLEEAVAIAEKVLSMNCEINNEPYFEQEYYSKLKQLIEDSLGDG